MISKLTTEHFDDKYIKLFEDTLTSFTKTFLNDEKKSQKMYSMHYPSVGLNFDKGILIIGRATNEWKPQFSSAMDKSKLLEECMAYSKESEGVCPLKWLGEELPDSNGKIVLSRSPFWQIAKGVAEGLNLNNGNNWTNNIAWSNLYKIAPADGGNPSTREGNAQWPGVRYLLEKEIEQLKPEHILFVTGSDWSMEFLGNLDPYKGDYVEETGWYKGAKTVICGRPEQKQREPFIAEVLEAFNNLN